MTDMAIRKREVSTGIEDGLEVPGKHDRLQRGVDVTCRGGKTKHRFRVRPGFVLSGRKPVETGSFQAHDDLKEGTGIKGNMESTMVAAGKKDLAEVAVLTLAVENVFRKLIRLLLGKISLKKLQEMIQVIFVEEAEAKLKKETPGKNVSLSTLAVVTGFDTRTITKIKSKDSYMKPFHEETRFLSEITPECSVLDVWESSPAYLDSESGKPRVLPMKGATPSFETLISDSNSTRGVTVRSFLQRLEASNSIVVDRAEDTVRMIDKRYTPFGSKDQTEHAKIGMAAVGNLVDTIAHNLTTQPEDGESFYQRGCWTNRLNRNDVLKLRKLIKKFLSKTDERARKIIKPFEQDVASNDQVTAGISIFYFEEEAAG